MSLSWLGMTACYACRFETSVEEFLFSLLRRRQQLEAFHGEVAEVLESDQCAGATEPRFND